MSNTMIATPQAASVPALAMNETELIEVLQSSVYPGAKLASIKLVIGACRASGKDPLKKPYHIVPMLVANGKKKANGYDEKEWRDVIMPGINDYRTDASRTGQHAGTSEPEFGPNKTETLGGVSVTYPEWCRVTVKRNTGRGTIAEYTAVERWKENYAVAGRETEAPNAMWRKRPYGQLAKCAEAQALRKGFPEVGSHATAEEMEGKEFDMGPAQVVENAQHRTPPEIPPYPQDGFDANLGKWRAMIDSGRRTAQEIISMIETKGSLTVEQKATICGADSETGEVVEHPQTSVEDWISAYAGEKSK